MRNHSEQKEDHNSSDGASDNGIVSSRRGRKPWIIFDGTKTDDLESHQLIDDINQNFIGVTNGENDPTLDETEKPDRRTTSAPSRM